MENPLLDWSKDQIKSALKKLSNKELLVIAMQWRMRTEECRHYYDQLMNNVNNPNDDTTTEDTPHGTDS